MDKRLLVLVGAALLVVGVFLPVANVQQDSLNLLLPRGSLGDGIFILVLAAIGAALALAGKTRHAIWPAMLSLAFLVWKYFQIKQAVDHAHAVIAEIGGGSEYATSVSDSMQMNMIGWAVLAIGAIVMILGAAMAWNAPRSAVPPTV
jgi:disulfide bond formation protein DsbB